MSNFKIRKGMILCAGLGTRLLPITEKSPKPLVPVLNVPNLVHTLFLLKRAGIEDVIVNLHHLPHQIESYIGTGRRWGINVEYSHEPLLLGTGGGLKKAEPFFKGEPFVLANCDFITNVDLRPFIAKHTERRAIATMILFKDESLQRHYSKVGVDETGHLCSLPSCQTKIPFCTGIFTGIHILENVALSYLKEVPCGINEVLYPQIMKEKADQVFAEFMPDRYWYDTGDLPTFWTASMKLLERLAKGEPEIRELLKSHGNYEEKCPGVFAPASVALPTNVEFAGPVIFDHNCSFGSGAKIGPSAIVGEGAVIGEGARVSNFVGLGAPRIAPREVFEGALQFQLSSLPVKKKAP